MCRASATVRQHKCFRPVKYNALTMTFYKVNIKHKFIKHDILLPILLIMRVFQPEIHNSVQLSAYSLTILLQQHCHLCA